jgi:hypothetical protein
MNEKKNIINILPKKMSVQNFTGQKKRSAVKNKHKNEREIRLKI